MNLVRFNRPADNFYVNHLANDLFDQLWRTDREPSTCTYRPTTNIFETEADFKLELLVPGYDKNEIEILVENKQLVVKSEQKETEKPEYKYAHVEYVKSGFEKRFKLSEKLNAEAISAEFKNGVLTIVIPKLKDEKQNLLRKIEIV